jgi:predicted TIM-barrel fold metal-dependent hydrolase
MINSHIHLIEEDPDEYLELLVKRMDEHGIAASVLFSAQLEQSLEDSAVREATKKYPGRFIPFLCKSVDISRQDSHSRCQDELQTGFWKGVGELFLDCTDDETVRYNDREGVEHIVAKPVPSKREDDLLYSGIFRFCGQTSLPVMVHCMDPAVMERTLVKYPETHFIWAHADHGFYNSIPMNLMRRHSNLCCDFGVEFRFLSAKLFSDQPESWLIDHLKRWREMCQRFPDRIFWGTDLFAWEDLEPESFAMGVRAWHRIAEGLTDDQKQAVAGRSILRLTGMAEQPLRADG